MADPDLERAGGQLVDALGELRRFLIGQRGDARLDVGRIHAARLELRLQVAALEERRDALARGAGRSIGGGNRSFGRQHRGLRGLR